MQEVAITQPPAITLTDDDDDEMTIAGNDTPTTMVDIEHIKHEFNTLVMNEDIKKEHALKIIDLQHAMESALNKHIYERDKEINRLTFELRISKLKQIQNDAVKKMNICKQEKEELLKKSIEDSTEFTRQIDEHVNTINRLQTAISTKRR